MNLFRITLVGDCSLTDAVIDNAIVESGYAAETAYRDTGCCYKGRVNGNHHGFSHLAIVNISTRFHIAGDGTAVNPSHDGGVADGQAIHFSPTTQKVKQTRRKKPEGDSILKLLIVLPLPLKEPLNL